MKLIVVLKDHKGEWIQLLGAMYLSTQGSKSAAVERDKIKAEYPLLDVHLAIEIPCTVGRNK